MIKKKNNNKKQNKKNNKKQNKKKTKNKTKQKKKKKKKKKKHTVNVLKILTHCLLFLQNAYNGVAAQKHML